LSPNINGETSVLIPSVRWTHEHEPVGPFRVTPPTSNLQTPAQRRAFMRGQLTNLDAVQPWYPFPLYAQRGYKTFDEFVDGYDWQPDTFELKTWTGFRHVYRINRAITVDPEGSVALYDFISATGASEHLGLPESDARYFTIV
jgi:hypothetical protein